ncbi:MAG: tryptophan 2,3-dioxygenase family protein [Phycisphaerae bacterium]|nr:tryptophan 2,3-dioxygenase family protein [Phycisphaerae bacterium]
MSTPHESGYSTPGSATQKSVTYAGYLRVDDLLKLQVPRSSPAEHDEMLFIVIHQVYELWFKCLLHEFDKVCDDLRRGNLHGAMTTFKRSRTIMKTLVGQLDILETMTPMEFSSFRDRLESASGFQSAQFRELEFLLGYKRAEYLNYFEAGSSGAIALARRLREPSVWDAFLDFLAKRGHAIPCAVLERNPEAATEPNEQVQEILFKLYKAETELSLLFELMVDFDEGLQEWRYRHVKMVERTIGFKPGTGGSSGAEFLRRTLFRSVFPDLWAIRHRL